MIWRSLARFCSALFALSVLTFIVVQAGCGKNNKEVKAGALPATKAGPVINQQAPELQSTPPVTSNPTFFPGTKAGPIFPKPASAPTPPKKKSGKNSNQAPFLPPSKSGNIFIPNQQ
jgi:hypothetical protein